jgi:hypothetical protein
VEVAGALAAGVELLFLELFFGVLAPGVVAEL